MKLNFKTIAIVFLVALLGASIGTFGVLELRKESQNINQNSNTTINTIQYPSIVKGDYSKAIDIAYDSVVEIQSTVITQSFFGTSSSYALGSGVIISEEGYIVTNNHVVENATDSTVKMHDGVTYPAKIIATDPRTDLAVLKIEQAKDLKPANIADSSQLILGQEAIVIGNPLGEGISCSNGIISALEKEITVNRYTMSVIQTNAAVNEGNSGGGLFDMAGNLIGIVNAKSSSNSYFGEASIEGMGYAIPSNTVKTVVKDLIDYGYVKARPALGISVYSDRTYTNGTYEGLMISSVQQNGAADKAGLKPGDIICKVDGQQITSYAVLSKMLDSYQIGDTITVSVLRQNQLHDVNIVLQETQQEIN